MFVMIMVYMAKGMTTITGIEWDVSTVTVGDYSADMVISQQ